MTLTSRNARGRPACWDMREAAGPRRPLPDLWLCDGDRKKLAENGHREQSFEYDGKGLRVVAVAADPKVS